MQYLTLIHIDPADLPACWQGLPLTVAVEAKAKELALRQLLADQARRAATPRPAA